MPKFYSEDSQIPPSPQPKETDEDLIKVYLAWKAPSRPFRKKDRSYYTTIAIIVVLLILIAVLAQETLLIGVLLALAFVAYVLGFVPPEDIDYKISSQGITIEDHFYFWDEMDSFWFSEKEGQRILHVLTHLRFPGQLMLVLGGEDEEKVKRTVAMFLPFHEIAPKSFIDNWAEKLQKHFPLETPRH